MFSSTNFRASVGSMPSIAMLAIFFHSNASFDQILSGQEFNTRYQHNESLSRWQSPLANASPLNDSPLMGPISQSHPLGLNQPFQYPASPQGIVQPAPAIDGVMSTVPFDVLTNSVLTHQPLPLVTGPAAVSSAQAPLGPMSEIELGSVVGSETVFNSTGYPEGYDPAYPIEYPGSTFKGYYPVDSGVIAPPENAAAGTAGSYAVTGSNNYVPPTISGVVVSEEKTAAGETGATSSSMDDNHTEQEVGATSTQRDKTDSSNQQVKEIDVAEKLRNELVAKHAEAIKKLKLQLQAAELRANEAAEKAVAISRQASTRLEELARIKQKLAKSNDVVKRLEQQQQVTKKQLTEASQKLAVANEQVKMQRIRVSESRAKAVQKEKMAANKIMSKNAAQETEDQKPSTTEATRKSDALVKLQVEKTRSNSADNQVIEKDANTTSKAAKSKKTADGKSKPRKKSLREKVKALEQAREKQLASASERIRSDFQKKIDKKLDSGKTKDHPEVRSLRDSMKDRLEDSNEKIRRRYQRQINRLWKEAAARSRS